MAFLLALLLWAPLIYWRGYVFVTLWGWFITPISPELPPPTIYVAVGALIVAHAFLPWPSNNGGSENTAAVNLARSALLPLFLLGFGALWHWLHWGVL